MYIITTKCLLFVMLTANTLNSVNSINCYQCSGTDSNEPFECNEYLDTDTALIPTDCNSIHDAQYCIKHVGRFEVKGIECFQCNSSSTLECSDGLMTLDGGILTAVPCDHVYNAQYCIKLTGLNGGISTKRYCSSLDLGNYCNYVQQPGDKLEYRTCIHTCNTDGCNGASSVQSSAIFSLLVLSISIWIIKV
ncbi:uncharacterized protein LOC125065245 [Vanessa atalanta]|uniref:uncharacterized protein LOC125065245 n=1 Tax=Vanessa atalanta TaxID=42275 RepID=UPI001FCCCFC1|nr:uncharacterized protein LOC125065245 [Vanessa atalanta]